jgi:hypothetical protein
LDSLPEGLQEMAVVDDMLYMLLGVEGRYVKSAFPEEQKADGYLRREFAIEHSLGALGPRGFTRVFVVVGALSMVVYLAWRSAFWLMLLVVADKPLKEMVLKILPICQHYNVIGRLVDGMLSPRSPSLLHVANAGIQSLDTLQLAE